MSRVRQLLPVLVLGVISATRLTAQQGTISGRVVDANTQRPLQDVTVMIEGTQRTVVTQADGNFALSGMPAGSHRLRVARIGYGPQVQVVTLASGATANVQFALQPFIAVLEEVVVTGYGTQRREAITGSVATINPDAANVGITPSVNEMLQGRAAGVNIIPNNGEPGAGVQIRIRGGTSISASNEPLYVIDGVIIQNTATEAEGIGIGGRGSLSRNPLNLLNPADIASITVLKDASATAIYGARAANGVILIETKKGTVGGEATMEYDGYVAMASPARRLNVLSGAEYRQFVQAQVAAGNLTPDRLTNLGAANTDWEKAVTRTAMTTNHNLSWAGGTADTRYRASLNYMNQQGVVLSSGFERFQGRLNASHNALNNRLSVGVNLTASHVANDYLPYETEGGFEGGVFQNVAVFNPTQPVKVTDPATGQEVFYEIGTGRQSVRNPVAIAEQVEDFGKTTRTLGNIVADFELVSGLTAQLNVGADRSDGTRRTYFPKQSPVGAEWNGRARQVNRDNTSVTFQSLLTLQRDLSASHAIDVVGGYEFNEYTTAEFGAEARGFLTDAFSFNNLGGGATLVQPFSWREESRLVSFFSRANYSLNDKYFLTGVLRYDGSSRFGAGNKWALFPAVSASWRLSEDGVLSGTFSDLRLRAGWGLQGNPAVPPYASLILLETSGGARYVFGEQAVTGVAPVRNPNPDLKWEQTAQFNLAADFSMGDNRLSGTVEYYRKTTSDLLLEVAVPQPAAVSQRLENIGEKRNQGVEITLEAVAMSRPSVNWVAGLVFALEREEVVDLGGRQFISTGFVSGQGQSGQVSQRIMPGHPLGTFYGPEFVRVCGSGESACTAGQQVFNKYQVTRDPQGRELTRTLVGETTGPGGDDYVVIGNANPDFTLGLRSRGDIGSFDFSFLIRSSVGNDVFNNTALVYSTKGNALQDKNFLAEALDDRTGIREPAIFSSRWIEDGSFVRLQNLTVGYTFDMPRFFGTARSARAYVSGDNLLLLTGYSGLDPEAHSQLPGLAVRGVDYLNYPRPRTFTGGLRVTF
jgi:iron complex outermembrane receptor protein